MNQLESDISREGFTFQKGLHFLRVLFSKRATQVLDAVTEFEKIDFDRLWKQGRKWLILDIDECIAPHHGEVLQRNFVVLSGLIEKGFCIVIFSNMKKTNRYDALEQLWIRVVTSRFAKPDIRWFRECLAELNMEADNTVMIWDNYLTDGGCRYAGIPFIKVRPIDTPNVSQGFSRKAQLFFRNGIDTLAEKVHHTLSYR